MPEKLVGAADRELPGGSVDGNPGTKQGQDIQLAETLKWEAEGLLKFFLSKEAYGIFFMN